MKNVCIMSIVLLALLLSGCAKTKYQWGSYENSLHKYYKDPVDIEVYQEALKEIISDCESGSDKIPPGIYAEYGYLLYEQSKFTEAIKYFQKEHDLWPESRALMQKMIRNAGNRAKPKNQQAANNPS